MPGVVTRGRCGTEQSLLFRRVWVGAFISHGVWLILCKFILTKGIVLWDQREGGESLDLVSILFGMPSKENAVVTPAGQQYSIRTTRYVPMKYFQRNTVQVFAYKKKMSLTDKIDDSKITAFSSRFRTTTISLFLSFFVSNSCLPLSLPHTHYHRS